MAFLGNEPKRDLTTERVPGGRRAALLVAVAATLVVGTLIWKPWDSVVPAASPTASFGPVAAAPRASEPASIAPIPTDLPPPVDLAPPPMINTGNQIFESPGGVGSLAFYISDGPAVHCIYRAKNATAQAKLRSMVVESPVVITAAGSSAQTIRMHVELEANQQDKIFEASWQPVKRSVSQRATLLGSQAKQLDPMMMKVPAAGPITIYRATIVAEWLNQQGQVLDVQEVHPTIYGPLGDANFPLGPGGCAAAI